MLCVFNDNFLRSFLIRNEPEMTNSLQDTPHRRDGVWGAKEESLGNCGVVTELCGPSVVFGLCQPVLSKRAEVTVNQYD